MAGDDAKPIESRIIGFFIDFISKHYHHLPRRLQNVVFLLILFFFFGLVLQVFMGQFSVRGRILVADGDGYKAAKKYDVSFGDRTYGSNWQGVYYLSMGPMQFAAVNLKRKASLGVLSEHNLIVDREVPFDPPARFEDIRLSSAQALSFLRREPEQEAPGLLVSPAYAAERPQGDRLFVRSLELGQDKTPSDEGRLTLFAGGSSRELRSDRVGGQAVKIPLLPGGKMNYDADYYFPLPELPGSSLSGRIEVAVRNVFSGYSEKFDLSAGLPYGSVSELVGDRGSRLALVRLSPYDVVVYEKRDLERVLGAIRGKAAAAGFRVVTKDSPLGESGETNAVFAGRGVPYSELQSFLRVLRGQDLKIKRVQYKLDLKSGNPNEIQLGASRALESRRPLSAGQLDRLIRAPNEAEFSRLLSAQ